MDLKRALIGLCLAAGTAATPAAFAHGGVALQIGVVAPPAPVVAYVPAQPVVAYVPAPRYGYVWVPGHWGWYRGQQVWKRGHYVRHKHAHRHYDRYAYRY